jgi:hypothetical protein
LNPNRKAFLGLLIALALLALGLFQAAHSHADPMSMDDQFIALAQRDGFASHSGYAGLISVAHQVCSSRMNGASETVIINAVFSESELTHYSTAAALVHDAEQVYCPGYYGGGGVT